jgi:hypothetical protein
MDQQNTTGRQKQSQGESLNENLPPASESQGGTSPPHMGFLRRFFGAAIITNWLMVLATITIAVSTIVYTRYSGNQLETMGKQLEGMQDTGKQTNRLIEEAVKQSRAARDNADTSILMAEAAKKSIEITQNNIRLDQRAWVGVVEVVKPDFKVGSKVTFGVTFMNSGKTPARKLAVRMHIDVVPANQEVTPTYPTMTTKSSVSVLQPGGRNNIHVLSDEAVTQALIEALRNGSQIVYIFGEITYEDIFSRSHRTTFCMYIRENLEVVPTNCHYYNDAD